MSTQPSSFVTPEEYLERERQAEFKSEYFNGQIFAMAGGTPRHSTIIWNIGVSLLQQLKGRPCNLYGPEVRLRVSPTGLYTYPDIMVICGGLLFADDRKDTVTNPLLIMEVLSPSTRDYDRAEKFLHYRTLPSLQEYLTVAQDEARIEQRIRQADGDWLFRERTGTSGEMELPSIGCSLKLSDVYDKIDWS